MDSSNPIWIQLVTLSIMLFGLLGLLIPVLPGLVIIWVAALVYGLITGFSWASGIIMVVLTILMAVGSLIDNFIMGASARQTGASWWAIGAALTAGIVGSILLPPFGGLVLALAALFAVEYGRLKNWRQAVETTRSMAFGCGWSVVVRLAIGVIMIMLWGAWVIWI